MTNVKGILATAPVVSRDSVVSTQMEILAVSVAEAVVKVLENLGVEYAFGVSGGAIAPIWAALEDSSIKVMHFRHEAGAAFAAVEASFASDRPVAVFATTGPGITNTLTGLFAARWEGAKVIFLSASTSHGLQGRWACQETSPHTMPEGLLTAGTLFHYAVTLESSEQLPGMARRLNQGISQSGGFVAHINITTTIQKSMSNVALPLDEENFSQSVVTTRKKAVKKCAQLLTQKRFAIWVGFGARGAAKKIRKLAKKTGAAVMCSPRGKGIFPEDHPQFVGVTGLGDHSSVLTYMHEYLPERVLVLGTRLGEFTSFWNPAMVPPEGFIHVDLDPQVPGTAYPHAKTISIQSDAKIFLKKLLKQIGKLSKQNEEQMLNCANKLTLEEFPRPQLKPIDPSTNDLVRPEVLMQAIQQEIVEGSDALVMAEPGNSFAWASNMLRFKVPGRYRTTTGFASMGHNVTGVIGATVALPKRKVESTQNLSHNVAEVIAATVTNEPRKAVAIVGDGAMLMNNEISTAVRYQVPAVWIVLNDGCYNMVNQVLPHLSCKDLVQIPQADFVQFARSMGADGIRVERESELEAALKKAMEATAPFVVDVCIDPSRKAPTETRMNSLKNQSLKEKEESYL
ncbi:thiamine pyrophosphate-binding protein [Microcoleus sp. N3A4]|uniref:thiamine pyrophosphate-dependent enzyme n=1 Tax=Microcoleus sp. N3A4 TaxID=3055379 RepID=UPI002FD1CFF7